MPATPEYPLVWYNPTDEERRTWPDVEKYEWVNVGPPDDFMTKLPMHVLTFIEEDLKPDKRMEIRSYDWRGHAAQTIYESCLYHANRMGIRQKFVVLEHPLGESVLIVGVRGLRPFPTHHPERERLRKLKEWGKKVQWQGFDVEIPPELANPIYAPLFPNKPGPKKSANSKYDWDTLPFKRWRQYPIGVKAATLQASFKAWAKTRNLTGAKPPHADLREWRDRRSTAQLGERADTVSRYERESEADWKKHEPQELPDEIKDWLVTPFTERCLVMNRPHAEWPRVVKLERLLDEFIRQLICPYATQKCYVERVMRNDVVRITCQPYARDIDF